MNRWTSPPLFVPLAVDQFTIKQPSPFYDLHVGLKRFSELNSQTPNQALNLCRCRAVSATCDVHVLSVPLDRRLLLISGLCFCDTHIWPSLHDKLSSALGRRQFRFPEAQENRPVKSRRPKLQTPDQGKNAARKAARSSSLDLELEATEGFLARTSLAVAQL